MTTSALTPEALDSIGFMRLHALAARGYAPVLGAAKSGTTQSDNGHACIAFVHPRAGRKNPPPPITLWSDGILSTSKVLFPEKFVPEDGKAPPDWQRYILPSQSDQFATFVSSIARPNLVDLYVKPAWTQTKVFVTKLMLGSTLCLLLGLAGKMVLAEI